MNQHDQDPDHQRRRVHFSGRVQGVGFRYTARAIAERHAVAGYVQNRHDGRVLLVVEGKPAVLDQFLGELAAEMHRHITSQDVAIEQAKGEFPRFEIRH